MGRHRIERDHASGHPFRSSSSLLPEKGKFPGGVESPVALWLATGLPDMPYLKKPNWLGTICLNYTSIVTLHILGEGK
jgi:hypothetical protein